MYEKCRENDNITLLLNTAVTGAEVDNRRIKKVIAERQSTEDIFHIHAPIFIDCTGDGRLGKEAGAPYRWGRESKKEFDETLAQDKADNKHQGSTLLFQARNVGYPTKFDPPKWARKFTEEDLKFRPHSSAGVDRGLEYGYWWVEWGGELDTIKDNETIRDELLGIMLGVWDHIKNDGDHGAENWALDWFGFLPGKRESRRFVGMHTLTESELLEATHFRDAIAYGGWSIDMHPPEGIDGTDLKPTYNRKVPNLFEIPLGVCISKGIKNLMFAGRNISATHVAFASTRVMATCAVVGQGVGTAAAYASKNGLDPTELLDSQNAIYDIQQNLIRDDAFLIGIINDDENDIARKASTITSSSEQVLGQASNVISGQTRAVTGPGGVRSDSEALPGTNRWMSNPSDGLPAWIEFNWDEKFKPNQIQLIFDSGMHRVLTLSHSDDYVKKMEWGKPQPELVKSYKIECWVNGKWESYVEELDNFQRRRVHQLINVPNINRMRITVNETQGIDHARICEVRVYTDTKY